MPDHGWDRRLGAVPTPSLSQPNVTRRPLKEFDTQLRLESLDGPRDRRGGNPELYRRLLEAERIAQIQEELDGLKLVQCLAPLILKMQL